MTYPESFKYPTDVYRRSWEGKYYLSHVDENLKYLHDGMANRVTKISYTGITRPVPSGPGQSVDPNPGWRQPKWYPRYRNTNANVRPYSRGKFATGYSKKGSVPMTTYLA